MHSCGVVKQCSEQQYNKQECKAKSPVGEQTSKGKCTWLAATRHLGVVVCSVDTRLRGGGGKKRHDVIANNGTRGESGRSTSRAEKGLMSGFKRRMFELGTFGSMWLFHTEQNTPSSVSLHRLPVPPIQPEFSSEASGQR